MGYLWKYYIFQKNIKKQKILLLEILLSFKLYHSFRITCNELNKQYNISRHIFIQDFLSHTKLTTL